MKIIKRSFLLLLIFSGLILGTHATPKMAIRSSVFFMGHPISAIKADIVDYEYSDGVQGFKITNPPIDRPTGVTLNTYIVSKKWAFYFARFEKNV